VPRLNRTALLDAILNAIYESGYTAVLITSPKRHPAEFTVVGPSGDQFELAVYAWTLTHGGRPQLPHEYRIQMTSVAPPLKLKRGQLATLVGYEPQRRAFAGFDLTRHRAFTPGSPSVQVDIRLLDEALKQGLAFGRKTNDEIVIGVRPDHFIAYALHAYELHTWGNQAAMFDLLTQAASTRPVSSSDLRSLGQDRRRIIETVCRLARLSNFRQTVLEAYESRCAVTGIQLKLVEAAHILPVGAPGSVDDIRNGIALSPTYHRAFDRGLIFLDKQFQMRVNEKKIAELKSLGLDGGISTFTARLGKIYLPKDRSKWPDPEFIVKANRYRNIADNVTN